MSLALIALLLVAATLGAFYTPRLRLEALIYIFAFALTGIVCIVAWNYLSMQRRARSHAVGHCLNNLRQIDGAIEQWALEEKKNLGDRIIPAEIAKYIKGQAIPTCPLGGSYRFEKIGDRPRCTLPGHSI